LVYPLTFTDMHGFKLASAFLLILLLLHSYFYNIYYNLRIWQRENEVKESIKQNAYSESLVVIKLPAKKASANLIDDDEIRYSKILYDVVKREIKGDTLYIYALADNKEDELIEKVITYTDTGITYNDTGRDSISGIKNNIKILSQPYTCTLLPKPYFFIPNRRLHYTIGNFFKYFTHAEIATPPPKKLALA